MSFVKTTLLGGILFLIPTVAILFILTRAFEIIRKLSKPIADAIPFTQVAGVGILTLISIILLVIICLIAGLFMRTSTAKAIVKWLEDKVLVYIPGYSYIKARSEDSLTAAGTNWKPACVFIDDNEVLCFVIDETENYCSIFLPSAPSPSSGTVCVREKKLVTFLPISITEAVFIIRQFGRGGAVVIDNVKSGIK